jgi:hypothetical protein
MKYSHTVLIILMAFFTGCTTIAKNERHEIDFTLIKGIPVVNVSINGIATKLAIDTGADNDEICITRNFIADSHLTEIDGTSQSVDVNGTKHTSKYYLAKDVVIGENKLSNVLISEEQREIPFDGIIGNKLLEKLGVIAIDYRNNTINFYKSENIKNCLSSDNWTKISYTKSKEGITLPVIYNNTKYSFLFDTGNAVFFNTEVYGIISKKSFDKISTTKNTQSITMNDIKIDTTYFKSLSFYAVELPEMFNQDGLLGFNILQNKKIIIDFDHNRLYLSVD